MAPTRRKFTLEFRIEAAHRVIDSGRSVTEVAREISVAELVRLRRQVAEQEKDNEFLKKAAAYFAANPPKRKGSL
jgi:transposase